MGKNNKKTKKILPKGTIRFLKSDPTHCYIKTENLYFAWWERVYYDKEITRKPKIRMCDEQTTSQPHFKTFVPANSFLKRKEIK